MTATAITMMVLFLLVIWGGMALAMVHYVRHPDDITESDAAHTRGT